MNEKEAIERYMHSNGLEHIDVKAALIDMDGVLFDSMKLHSAAWYRLATEMGIECTRDEFFLYEGMTGAATINLIHRRQFGTGVSADEAKRLYAIKAKYFVELGAPDPMPGADVMLNCLRSNGIDRVLVTGSGQKSVLDRLSSTYPGIFADDRRITAADVTKGKPHPEPYLKGAALAGVPTSNCIVIENAPLGVKAGKAAGAFTIAITTGPVPREEMEKAGADIIYDSMPQFAEGLPALLEAFKQTSVAHEHQRLEFTNQVDEALTTILAQKKFNKLFVLTDSNTHSFVWPLLADNYFMRDAHMITIMAGDINKNLDSLTHVWEELGAHGGTRHSLLINLGGGVVTDLGGFAAATFKRGIDFVNVPTTLLSAVDAAVGGKTGINFGGLKNEIGAFCEASAVVISTAFLATLPEEEIKSGFAEMLKHGLISDAKKYDALLAYDFTAPNFDQLLDLLEDSVKVKSEVVRIDPHEKGLRRALNLGHTVGHAFESMAMMHEKPIPHGYAVAWGLAVEIILSHLKQGLSSKEVYRLTDFVRDTYGAFFITCDDYPALLQLMRHDKKSDNGEINCTLLAGIGDIKIDCIVTEDEMREALDLYRDIFRI